MFIAKSWSVVESSRFFIIEMTDVKGEVIKIPSFASIKSAEIWAKENIRIQKR